MERDARRDLGQWRGCHSFKDIICDGDEANKQRRNGGLKMGHKYYYYVSRSPSLAVAWLTRLVRAGWRGRST